MSRFGLVSFVIFVAVLGGCAANVDVPSAASALVRDDIERKIDALLAKMTLEEKVGQLNQFSDRAAARFAAATARRPACRRAGTVFGDLSGAGADCR